MQYNVQQQRARHAYTQRARTKSKGGTREYYARTHMQAERASTACANSVQAHNANTAYTARAYTVQ
eukprot:11187131-Lingulodinium_polyedra.AAC.1